jgi:predicted DNA-binding protein (UPF0251 family)
MSDEEREKYVNQDYVGRSFSYTNPDRWPNEKSNVASLYEQISIPESALSTPCISIAGVLTPKQLEAVRLVFVEGLSYKKAGDILGIEPMSVSDRIAGARKKLRRAFNKTKTDRRHLV